MISLILTQRTALYQPPPADINSDKPPPPQTMKTPSPRKKLTTPTIPRLSNDLRLLPMPRAALTTDPRPLNRSSDTPPLRRASRSTPTWPLQTSTRRIGRIIRKNTSHTSRPHRRRVHLQIQRLPTRVCRRRQPGDIGRMPTM